MLSISTIHRTIILRISFILFAVTGCQAVNAIVDPNDSLALVSLYNSTNGPGWRNHTNWLTGSVKTWYGVTVETLPVMIGNGSIVAKDMLTQVNLAGNGLDGIIPEDIGNSFGNLKQLRLDNNHLHGAIPVSLGNLHLYGLYLNNNQLTGAIPSSFQYLYNLLKLNLSNNQLSGAIPPELGNLANLQALYLGGNQFSGSIPATLKDASNLKWLYLSNNQLSGTILPLQGLSNLQWLYLSHNQFSGSIPESLSGLSDLQGLFLFNNLLNGNIPSSFCNSSNLNYLFLSDNHFTGLPGILNAQATVESNFFTFDDLIPNLSHVNTYSPQGKAGIAKTTKVIAGDTYTIDLGIDPNISTNTYTWHKNGQVYTTTTVNKLVIPNVTPADDGVYTCIITNPEAPELTLTSYPDTLSVVCVQINTQTGNQTLCEGNSVIFYVDAIGAGLTYQWQKNISGSWIPINGATSPALNLTAMPAMNGQQYQCVITGSCGVDTSKEVTLIINSLLQITSPPIPQIACEGSDATFSVIATGTNLTYQWQQSGDGGSTWENIDGAESADYTITNVRTSWDQYKYQCLINSACGTLVTSNAVELTVIPHAQITADPNNMAVCEGSTVNFLVSATGPELTYQWEQNTSGSWEVINGATGSTYSLYATPELQGRSYHCVVTGTCGPVTSNAALLTLGPQIIDQPADQPVCEGGTAMFGNVTAIGPEPFMYQWQQSTDGGNTWNDIDLATDSKYVTTVASSMDGYLYHCIVTGSCGSPATSMPGKITIPYTHIEAPLANQTVCEQDVTTIGISATGLDLTYQWQQSTDGAATWNDITDETGDTYTFEGVSDINGYYFRCRVGGSCGEPVASNGIQLTVNPLPQITSHPASQTLCEGETLNLTTSADGDGLTYQWQQYITSWEDISGATGSVYSAGTTISMNGRDYKCRITGTCSVNTEVAQLTVNDSTQITAPPANFAACVGSTAGFWVVAAGADLIYQWQQSTDEGNSWSDITGATEDNLSINSTSAMNGYLYHCVVTGNCGSAITSGSARLTIITDPALTGQPTNQTVVEENTVSFSVGASGTNPTYQWQNSLNGEWSDISGATTNTYEFIASETLAGSYRCMVSGVCASDASVLTVLTKPKIAIQPENQEVCEGNSAIFSVSATGYNLTYQWQKSADGVWSDISEATGETYEVTATASEVGGYQCVINGFDNIPVTTNTVQLSLIQSPQINTQPADTSVCSGGTASFKIYTTGTEVTYQWQQSTDGGTTFEKIDEATAAILNVNATSAINGYVYRCLVIGSCGVTVTSNVAQITVNSPVQLTTQPTGIAACDGTLISFYTGATGSALTYRWQEKTGSLWNDIAGAADPTYSTTITSSNQGTWYQCIVSGTCGTETTNSALLSLGTQIATQPSDESACDGSTVTFHGIAVIGVGPFTYQWQQSTDNGSSWNNVDGATASDFTLNVNASMNGYLYHCIVIGSCGLPATSNSVRLTIYPPTGIADGPANQTECDGNQASFSVNATGEGLTYQWEQSTDGSGSWQDIATAVSQTMNIPVTYAMNNYNYRCKVKGTCDASWLHSEVATLTAIQNTISPLSATATNVTCENGNPNGSITLAQPTSDWLPLTYTWSNGASSQNISSLNAGNYKVTITDSHGCKASLAKNVEYDAPIASNLSVTDVYFAGNASGEINPHVSGGHTPLTYQWSNGAVTDSITGLKAGTYSLTVTDNRQCTKSITATVTEPSPIVYIPISKLKSTQPVLPKFDSKLPVGTIAGSSGVSPSGAATYEIPIPVLPGLGSMEPKISIAYNSQGGNGLLGWGFNISGISAITRVPHTIYHNGSSSGISLTKDDIFALDGNRLMVTKYKNGDDGSQYVTENETYSFSEITLYQKWIVNEYIPDRWVVKTKTGTTFEYGNQTACLSVRYEDGHGASKKAKVNWLLNSAEDIYGNFITYTYEQNGLNTYIKKISYGSNKNNDTKNYNTVEFFYKQRADLIPVHYYQANGTVDQLLDRIEVKSPNALFRSYSFGYTIDDFSRLVTVTERTADGKQLNPTIINWGINNTSTIVSREVPFEKLTNESFAKQNYTVGDMNGDGVMDLISFYDDNFYATTHIASYTPNEIMSLKKGTSYFLDQYYSKSGEDQIRQPGSTAFGDFNGDGKTDIIVPRYDNLNGYNRLIFYIYKDANKVEATIWSQLAASSEVPIIAYADLNNDGIDDIIYIEKGSKDNRNYPGKIHLSNGTNSYSSTWIDFNVYSSTLKPEKICIADFNGDGMQDIMILNATGYKIILSPHEQKSFTGNLNNTGNHFNSKDEIRLGDFNGDGYPDFIVRKMDKWYFEMNKTYDDQRNSNPYDAIEPTFETKPLPGIKARDDKDTDKDNDKDNIIVTDFNNDGKSDVIICDATYDQWNHSWGSSWKSFTGFYTYWYKSTGDNLILDKTPAKSGNAADAYNKYFITGDFNGDGRTELMNYGYDCYTGKPQNQAWRSYGVPNYNNESGVITAVINGLNQKTEFLYKPLTDSSVYKKTSVNTYPQTTIIGPLYVVSQMKADNGVGGQTSIYNKYNDATVHREGKGFLGFAKTTQTNETINSATVTSSEFNKSLFTLDKQTTELFNGSTLVSRTMNTYNVNQLDNKHIFMYLEESESKDSLKNITILDTYKYYFNYNQNYGYLTNQNRYYNRDFYVVEKTFSGYDPVFGNLGSISTKMTRKGEPAFTQNQSFIYDVKGKLASSAVNGLTTSYTYDVYGNPVTIATSAAGLETRRDSSVYDASNRFLEKHYNALHHSLENFYDDKGFGLLQSTKDANLQETSYHYDSWGSPTETITPDKKTVISSRNYVTISDPYKPVYALYYAESSVTEADNTKKFAGGEYFDMLGRSLRKITVGFDGAKYYTNTKYNAKGQVEEVTEPYLASGTASKKTSYTYDDYGRTITETLPDDVVKTYKYVDGSNKVETSYSTGEKYSKTSDATGKTIEATDPGGTITYDYTSTGKTRRIVSPGSIVEMTYDHITDLQDTLKDPDAGNTVYGYNTFGELTSQVDSRGKASTMAYDRLGRITNKTTDRDSTQYAYDAPGALGLTDSISSAGKASVAYKYDRLGRITSETRRKDNQSFTYTYGYDTKGRVSKLTYPKGFAVKYIYNDNDDLMEMRDSIADKLIWKLDDVNSKGQVLHATYGNQIQTEYGYDSNDRLNRINVPGIIDFNYEFNDKQQLNYRDEKYIVGGISKGFREDFTYDEVNRLKTAIISGIANPPPQLTMDYTHSGQDRITNKSDAGDFTYQAGNHRIDHLSAVDGYLPPDDSLTYTAEGKINTIEEAHKLLSFVYGVDGQRFSMAYKYNDTLKYTRYYFDNYEKDVMADGTERHLNYIYAGGNLVAIQVQQAGTDSTFYVYTDYLGSLRCITDSARNVKQRLSYDAWGNRRDPITGAKLPAIGGAGGGLLFARGFTGHEHLDEFGLINMNGRVYDPVLGVFLSPDNYVQQPDNTQNFNRYAYCVNNPLMYTDPNGEWINLLVGALFGGAMNLIIHANNIHNGSDAFHYFGIGAVAGAIGAGVSSGISSTLANGSFSAGFFGTASAKAVTGFIGGFISGAGGGFAGGFLNGYGNSWAQGGDRMSSGGIEGIIGLGFGGLTGGIFGGIDATSRDREFWTGRQKLGVYVCDGRVVNIKDINSQTTRNTDSNGTENDPGGFKKTKFDDVNNRVALLKSNPNVLKTDRHFIETYYIDKRSIVVPDDVTVTELRYTNNVGPEQTLEISINKGPNIILNTNTARYWNTYPIDGSHISNIQIGVFGPRVLCTAAACGPVSVKILGYRWVGGLINSL